MIINPEMEMSVEKYLKSDFQPDCELVDGFLHERSWGEMNHSRMHAELCGWAGAQRDEWPIIPLISIRIDPGDSSVGVAWDCSSGSWIRAEKLELRGTSIRYQSMS